MSEIVDITDYGNHQPYYYDEYYSVPFGAMQEEYHNDIRNIRDALFYACNALEGQLEGCEDEELISQNNKAIELIEKLLKRKKI